MPDRDHEAEFKQFHRENPQVYEELVKLARHATRVGKRKIGIKMLWEVMRWQRWLASTDSEFKLNNNHHSRYARLIMAQEPDLEGVFELRELKTAGESVSFDPNDPFLDS